MKEKASAELHAQSVPENILDWMPLTSATCAQTVQDTSLGEWAPAVGQ